MKFKTLEKIHSLTFKVCRRIMVQKNSDYTGGKKSTDPFANFKASSVLGVNPIVGISVRIMDKLQRIRSFSNDKMLSVPNESVYDACDDIVNYAILIKAMIMEERDDCPEYNDSELDLIVEAHEEILELRTKQKEIYDQLLERIQPNEKLKSCIDKYVSDGVQCYLYDIEEILSKKDIDEVSQ